MIREMPDYRKPYPKKTLPNLNAKQEKIITEGTTYKGPQGNPDALAEAKAKLMRLFPGGADAEKAPKEVGPSVTDAQLTEEAIRYQKQSPDMRDLSLEQVKNIIMRHRYGYNQFGKKKSEEGLNQ